jgi:hypothetical protein
MKNLNDPIESRNRDLLICSAVPQPSTPRQAVGFYNEALGTDYLYS